MIQMLAIVLAVVATLGFVKFQQISKAIAGGKAFTPPPEAITTVVAEKSEWATTLDAVGSVAPVQGVTLSADLPGVVDGVGFVSGTRVAKNQVLLTLDSRQERAQLASAEARLELARLTLDRSHKLLAQNAIAQSEFDITSAQYKQAEAAVAESQAAIDRKTIRAPFAGVTGIRQVNVGQYVHSGDPVVPLQSLDAVYANFSVPQQNATVVRAGAVVHATVDGGNAFSGRVTAIDPVISDATRNVNVQATPAAPGAYVTVQVVVGRGASTVALPTSAINYAPYGNSVFILEDQKGADGKPIRGVRQQFVKLGRSQGDQVAILDGVLPGQEVATSGVFKLRPGATVLVNNKTQPSNSRSPRAEDN
jgi:membrane fusion protein (multidrug efflux system)